MSLYFDETFITTNKYGTFNILSVPPKVVCQEWKVEGGGEGFPIDICVVIYCARVWYQGHFDEYFLVSATKSNKRIRETEEPHTDNQHQKDENRIGETSHHRWE